MCFFLALFKKLLGVTKSVLQTNTVLPPRGKRNKKRESIRSYVQLLHCRKAVVLYTLLHVLFRYRAILRLTDCFPPPGLLVSLDLSHQMMGVDEQRQLSDYFRLLRH